MEQATGCSADNYEALYRRTLGRLERERKIRREAEAIAERGLRELYRLNDQQKLLETIVSYANTTSSGRRVIEVTLEETCKSLGMTCGIAFLRERETGFSRGGSCLYSPGTPETLENALAACRASKLFEPGGIASQIAEEQKILSWMPGPGLASLSHALGLPVIAGGAVRALLVFFSCAEVRAEEPIVGLCMNIGGHIARVMEREDAQKKLLYDATHDALTGLPNRTSFHKTLANTLRVERLSGVCSAVCLIDLDRFKDINDHFGHTAGDMFLTEAARRLSQCVRSRPDCTLARLGGDEFTACLAGLPDREEALHIAKHFCHALNQPFLFDGHELHSSASIGIAFCEPSETDISKVLKAADLAMYESKKQGGGRVTMAS
ncbi:diguanylate cyclase [Acetobacter musti]|uniref:Diguanylate cyclase n=1 Tax=Acetobacter musti TaxID=864732 RepID=A0ABX0JKC0_9PROT|nr:GGDEF domain-containing protein [Acetobacter musti]NHN83804.1 diguanylate cyclase [Acetobacter musti]